MKILKACFGCCQQDREEPAHKVLRLRLDEAHKAYQALHAVLDVVQDERQLRKLREAQKLTGELHYDLIGRHKTGDPSLAPTPTSSQASSARSFASARAPLVRAHSHG